MIEVDIPGGEKFNIAHLVLDYNGTLAVDGELLEEVVEKMEQLSIKLKLHVITADTHGTVGKKIAGLPCCLHIIGPAEQDKQKEQYVRSLEAQKVVAIGNGRNDTLMLGSSALGIVILQAEGAAIAALLQADIICTDIRDAFDLLLQPNRLIATLRN